MDYLFHKEYLGIDVKKPLYDIIQQNTITKKYLCRFHIYDMNKYDEFNKYITKLIQYFDIIITTSILSDKNPKNITILKIQNVGFDVGSMMCFFRYLEDNNILYEYVLFLHSKTQLNKRKQYIEPFVDNLDNVVDMMKNKITNIFPAIEHTLSKQNDRNHIYYDNMMEYFNITSKSNSLQFIEGNCFITNSQIIKKYIIPNINKFYSNMNYDNSFDVNWYIKYYKLEFTNVNDIYEHYKNNINNINNVNNVNNVYGNNLPIHKQKIGMRDAMFEHVFERVWLSLIENEKQNYYLLYDKPTINIIGNKISILNSKISKSHLLSNIYAELCKNKYTKLQMEKIINELENIIHYGEQENNIINRINSAIDDKSKEINYVKIKK